MTARYKQEVLIDFYLTRDYYTAMKQVGALFRDPPFKCINTLYTVDFR